MTKSEILLDIMDGKLIPVKTDFEGADKVAFELEGEAHPIETMSGSGDWKLLYVIVEDKIYYQRVK